jgi:hypothetical protein
MTSDRAVFLVATGTFEAPRKLHLHNEKASNQLATTSRPCICQDHHCAQPTRELLRKDEQLHNLTQASTVSSQTKRPTSRRTVHRMNDCPGRQGLMVGVVCEAWSEGRHHLWRRCKHRSCTPTRRPQCIKMTPVGPETQKIGGCALEPPRCHRLMIALTTSPLSSSSEGSSGNSRVKRGTGRWSRNAGTKDSRD